VCGLGIRPRPNTSPICDAQRCCGSVFNVYLNEASSKEGDNDSDDVDGQLELEELCDAVVHVATPHHRFHDTREVVVRENDVRRLLCHVRASDALSSNAHHGE